MSRLIDSISHSFRSSYETSSTSIIVATALTTFVAVRISRFIFMNKKVKIIKSPAATLLPTLSQAEKDALPYPPDCYPGGRAVDSPVLLLPIQNKINQAFKNEWKLIRDIVWYNERLWVGPREWTKGAFSPRHYDSLFRPWCRCSGDGWERLSCHAFCESPHRLLIDMLAASYTGYRIYGDEATATHVLILITMKGSMRPKFFSQSHLQNWLGQVNLALALLVIPLVVESQHRLPATFQIW